jgi:uncharacterized protein YjbI with pentapeptide repeats
LSSADLHNADLRNADLRNTNLYGAFLFNANLCGANLHGTDLRNANLSCAILRIADLSDTYMNGANLHNADLSGANLYNASLHGAYPLIEYRKGKMLSENIIGYKKCKDNIIVTLEIPKGAIVFSINGNKCRTNKAKVIAIEGSDRAFSRYEYMSYYVGDEFTIYDFNCEYNQECTEGIHFFISREEAENYIE